MYSQQQVRYRRGYPMRQCGTCSMYRKGSATSFGRCTAVSGQITPYGLCDIFDQLNNPYGNRLTSAHRHAMNEIYDHAHGRYYDRSR